MPIDASEQEIDFYMKSQSSVTELETLEISHPDFSEVFRVTFNDALGFEALDENGNEVFYQYVPMNFKGSTLSTNLDYALEITFGDLGTLIQKQLDRVEENDSWHINPTVIYRSYRSDRLDYPMRGPIFLEIGDYTYNKGGFAFKAQAPDLKQPGTGMLFSLENFPTLLAYFYT